MLSCLDQYITCDCRSSLLRSGKISEIQLGRITYAGQIHESRLPQPNVRAGISVSDSTGVGKIRTILGIILGKWFSIRKRTVRLSVKFDLIKVVQEKIGETRFSHSYITHQRLETGRTNYDATRHRFCTY